MSRFRKKPVEIEAVQFSGEGGLHGADNIFKAFPDIKATHYMSGTPPYLVVDTLEGKMIARAGDWIIRGVRGEFYPCKPDIFAATYEPADDDAAPVAPQRDPSNEDGWVRFYFDDADPVAECACGWHTHGDSASDAFGAWWKHRREHDDAAGEQRPVVLSARVDLDLDQIEARYNDWYGRGYDNEPLTRKRAADLYPYAACGDETRSHYIVRNDLPALVDEVRRLREDLAYAVADAKRWHDAWQERGRIYEADTTALRAEVSRVREALQAIRDLCDEWANTGNAPDSLWLDKGRADFRDQVRRLIPEAGA